MITMTKEEIREEAEARFFKRFITEIYPSGFASYVSDTFDLWAVITKILPRFKKEIMGRDGKVVIRPDSGNPVDIICGKEIKTLGYVTENFKEWKYGVADRLDDELRILTPHGENGGDITDTFTFDGKVYEVNYDPDWDRHGNQYYIDNFGSKVSKCTFTEKEISDEYKGVVELLWEIFGGTTNSLGYKELDSHIGAIYGDAITRDRAREILQRLKDKGFASTNIVFGIGSFTYQYNTRDTLGFALKSTYVKVNGEERQIFKDPKTDSGLKKSAKGLVVVLEDENGELYLKDELTFAERAEYEAKGLDQLEVIYEKGELVKFTTLEEIRAEVRK